MVESDYKRARHAAVKELEKLVAVQQETEKRINNLRQMITALDALSGSPVPRQTAEIPRLTEAIRSLFKAAPPDAKLTARDVRRALLEMGFDGNKYSNFLASIHVVLRRLEEKGELEQGQGSDGYNHKDWLTDLERG